VHLSFPDVLNALNQLADTTSSDFHRAALTEALDAVRFRQNIEAAIERHHKELGDVRRQARPSAGPGTAWTAEEDVQLRFDFEAGTSLDVIASRLGRTPVAVALRLHKPLGILTEQAVEEIRAARSRNQVRVDAPPADVASERSPGVASGPALVEARVTSDAVFDAAAGPAAVPEQVVAALASVSLTPAAEPSPEVASSESVAGVAPELTAAEDAAVRSVLAKYTPKGAPRATLRNYIESDKFAAKVRPEVLVWLRGELARIG
jgi:hypothetical protein